MFAKSDVVPASRAWGKTFCFVTEAALGQMLMAHKGRVTTVFHWVPLITLTWF